MYQRQSRTQKLVGVSDYNILFGSFGDIFLICFLTIYYNIKNSLCQRFMQKKTRDKISPVFYCFTLWTLEVPNPIFRPTRYKRPLIK